MIKYLQDGLSADEAIARLERSFPGMPRGAADIAYGRANQAIFRGISLSAALNDLASGETPGDAGIRASDKEVVVTVHITDADGTTRHRTIRIDSTEFTDDKSLLQKINSVIDGWNSLYKDSGQHVAFEISYVVG